MKPQGDYIHFVDYKTGKPVSAEANEIKRCTNSLSRQPREVSYNLWPMLQVDHI